MATLLLQAVGAALGSALGPIGTAIGQAAGALAGAVIDQSIINSFTTVSGSQLTTARIPGAGEGTPVTRVYGTVRIGGSLIWATRFEEEVTTERYGGKAMGPKVRTYRYFANFALGLCEGPITAIRRVWADGQELDITSLEMRLYKGTADQLPDPLIEAKQGTGNAPAYRHLAYVVFERLPLDDFGNRIPVLQFEVLRTVGTLEDRIEAVTIIPGATEHGYNPAQVTQSTGEGSTRILNRNVTYASSDWQASIDELQALCPNLKRVSLAVSWFGTDLRADHCQVVPGVEVAHRNEESPAWQVSGVSRGAAHLISTSGSGPAFGGTPDDAAVIAAIRDLKARGLAVTLYPLMMMDIPTGNALTDPYGGAAQAAYPWRGRITATGDRTNAARTAIEAFCGDAAAGDFSMAGGHVSYTSSGAGYRRMILHYAHLAAMAGGVDGFIIGSEMRGLAQLRDASNAFPFVEQLVRLAGDVRGIVGSTTVLTYAADWSEYFGYHPQDGSGDVFFHLDPLWASSAIDVVGIDNYMPLADWRDDDFTGANPDGMKTADDRQAMHRAIVSGEGYDWYYADAAARKARTRSAITDGLAGKPWVFRYKDIEAWWANSHHNRTGGAELPASTAWTPRMKPIWFTELGCPAVDRGANQPNVFIDPKSAESNLPYFSSGSRSDLMQRRFLEAHYDWWASEDAPAGMLSTDHIHIWTWDARPRPAFPFNTDLFADGENWQTGHWLNGRLGAATLPDAIAAILEDNGFADFDVSAVSGDLTGYVQGDVVSPRQLIEPLMTAFQIDCRESGGKLVFSSRSKVSAPARLFDVVADVEGEPLWSESVGQESDFAAQTLLGYDDEANDYESAVARSRHVSAGNERVSRTVLPGVLADATAALAAEEMLRDQRLARRTISFRASPAALNVEPGDRVTVDGLAGRFRITRIEDSAVRLIEATEYAPPIGGRTISATPARSGTGDGAAAFSPVVVLMDLPRLGSGDPQAFASAAVLVRPWRTVTLASSPWTEGYRARALAERPATMGLLTAALPSSGVTGPFDHASTLEIDLSFGSFSSGDRAAVLAGENRLAVLAANGSYEILSFLTAQETSAGHWRLSGLLRGQCGTVDAAASGAPSGARVVLLNEAVVSLGLDAAEMGLALNWRAESSGGSAGPWVFAGGTRAATPLAPVHLKAKRLASGDISLSWVRCSRIDGENWVAYDIPLDEPEERYVVDVLSGVSAVRSIEVAGSSTNYSAAEELADFGVPQTSLAFRVRQVGWTVATGLPAEAELPL